MTDEEKKRADAIFDRLSDAVPYVTSPGIVLNGAMNFAAAVLVMERETAVENCDLFCEALKKNVELLIKETGEA